MRRILDAGLLLFLFAHALRAATSDPGTPNLYAKWPHGPPTDPAFLPLAVWLQSPSNAERYRQAGINTYVGLWKGPTEEQIARLKAAGMWLICGQNQVALQHLDEPTIIGWMHGDEPDNAQSIPGKSGWGPPIAPEAILTNYARMRAKDASRPVMLNLGQGVAWDQYYGRGVRSNHPEDYPQYLKGCDIISFDIYPVVHEKPEITGKLWYVARGVERLVQWSGGKHVVWNCLECTRISNTERKPKPYQVRAEAWMSLIHGSRGLIYFVHQFKPDFREAALLDDAEMLEGVSRLNREITRLAPVLNSPSLPLSVTVKPERSEVPIAALVKQHAGATYLFAVPMREGETTASFTLKGLSGTRSVEVLDEERKLACIDGSFQDHFGPWEVHLYRISQNATTR